MTNYDVPAGSEMSFKKYAIIIDDDISQGITQGRGLISQILDRSIPKKITGP